VQCLGKTGGFFRQNLRWQMKNERQRSATVPMVLCRQPCADNPDKTATRIIFGLFFTATDRTRKKHGSPFGTIPEPAASRFQKCFAVDDMRRRGKPKGRVERMCISYTSAGENSGKLSDENKPEFGLISCARHN
jgi:hypothetical protein